MNPSPAGTPLDPRKRPIEKFLGPSEATGGPFALLGVSPAACTDELVLSGLDRQVERINRHAECDTPEADEVRLAVHAAAAQLLDPVVRRHLITRWGGGGKEPQAVSAAPSAPQSRPTTPGRIDAQPRRILDGQRLLEADAILTLGLFGGWNQRALRRLVSLAHKRGLSNRQVAETVRSLARRRVRPNAPAAPPPPRRPASRLQPVAPLTSAAVEQVHSDPDPAQRILKSAFLFGLLGLAGLGAAVVGIVLATRQPSAAVAPVIPATPNSQTPAAQIPIVPDASPSAPVAKKANRPPPAPPDKLELAAIPRAIGACTDALAIDPEAAVKQLEGVASRLSAHWTAVPKDNLVAAHDALVEFLYRSGQSPGIAERAIAAIARHAGALEAGPAPDPSDVAPSVWSVGMLARLGRERDLTATAKNTIDTSLAAVMGQARAAMEPSFESGASAAVYLWPSKLTPQTAGVDASVDAWKAWAACAVAMGGGDAAVSNRYLLAGLETLIVQGPEPNQSKSVSEVAADITSRLTWRAGDESRVWLLRWFADSRVSAADLNVITSTMATKSAAEGVDLTMVLSTAAADNTRAELRERFATIWGVQESLARDEQITDWASQVREAINQSHAGSSEAEDFASAVVLARLNDAAWWQWRGDSAEALRLLADIRGPVEAAMKLTERERAETPTELSDGAWAEKYLASKNAPKVRREMIDRVIAGEQIGPLDAEVLVGEALSGTPQDVRNAAQDAVKKFADSATILNAMLERLPRAPRTVAVAELVSVLAGRALPGFRDAEWPMAARRAILERLLEALAAESPRVRIDRLSALLASSYRSMASASPIPPDQRGVKTQPAAHISAAGVWLRWRSAADKLAPSTPPPITLDQVERRRVSRLSQSKGMVQAFVAEQASIAEMMSYIVVCEHPGQLEQVRLILTNLASDRRHSTHVLEQIKVAERAMAQLWLIRFQQEPAS